MLIQISTIPRPRRSRSRSVRHRLFRPFLSSLPVPNVVLLPRHARHGHGIGGLCVPTPFLAGRPILRHKFRRPVLLHRHRPNLLFCCHLHAFNDLYQSDEARVRTSPTQIDSLDFHHVRHRCDDHPGGRRSIGRCFGIERQRPNDAEQHSSRRTCLPSLLVLPLLCLPRHLFISCSEDSSVVPKSLQCSVVHRHSPRLSQNMFQTCGDGRGPQQFLGHARGLFWSPRVCADCDRSIYPCSVAPWEVPAI